MNQPRFSARTAWETNETELARALRERKEARLPLLDLTASNPTQCGFVYDEVAILSPLAAPEALVYDPNPQGILRAREAVHGNHAHLVPLLRHRKLGLLSRRSPIDRCQYQHCCDGDKARPEEERAAAGPAGPTLRLREGGWVNRLIQDEKS